MFADVISVMNFGIIGGAFLAYFVRLMFGIGSGSPGLNAIASSIGALIIVPTHWRRR